MNNIKNLAGILLMATTALFTASCENDNINPYDYVGNNGNISQFFVLQW